MIYGGGGRWLKVSCWIISEAGRRLVTVGYNHLLLNCPKLLVMTQAPTRRKTKVDCNGG